jgi:hypothetical protein
MKTLIGIVFLAIVVSCSEPGHKYLVKITKTDAIAGSIYCSYDIESLENVVLPKDHIVDICNKYQVGDQVSIEINDLK